MAQVSADKAYLSVNNLQTVLDHNAMPYIPFTPTALIVNSRLHSVSV